MILVFAGRRPGQDFPPENDTFVSQQIRQLVVGLSPRLLVGSAAAGSDLLAIEAGLRVGAAIDVVVAGSREQFREASVTDTEDAERWGREYDSLLSADAVDLLELATDGEPSDEDFQAVTRELMARAEAAAEHTEEIVVLAVSAPKEGADHTEDLVALSKSKQRLVLRIDPTMGQDDAPQAFVAMPFGVKTVESRKWTHFDADLTYGRILAPVLIDAGYRPMRADTTALTEYIDRKMLRQISEARLMVADLSGLNPNVMWELGLRHGWRRAGTVLMMVDRERPPFDTARIPTLEYTREEAAVSDRDAVAAMRELQDIISDVDDEAIDSPVFAHFEALGEVELPPAAEHEGEETATEYLTRITLARDLRDPARLEELATEIQGSDLPEPQRQALMEQIGVQLISLGLHGHAAQILRPLAEADQGLVKPELQQRFCHALIRSPADTSEEHRLREAQARLEALCERGLATGELYGLLGSASKRRVELQLQSGGEVDARDVASAIAAYRQGFEVEPGDFYPGINVVALLRLSAQHWGGTDQDLREAMALLPVVRFAVTRKHDFGLDTWAVLTLAETELHEHLITGSEASAEAAVQGYGTVGRQRLPQHERSAKRQLELCRSAGDDAATLERMLEALAAE